VTAEARTHGSLWSANLKMTKTISQTLSAPSARTSSRRKNRFSDLTIWPP
jgi:hypothetical protein